MAYAFGDGFDQYAAPADAINGYWDSGGSFLLSAGRFAGSRGASNSGGLTVWGVKNSGQNDAIHHLSIAFQQTAALAGTNAATYLQLSDGATNQCCVVFRSDGAILLTSATPTGTTLATYTGAVTAANTWYQFEFEVVINNTTGRFRARKNGNVSDDFDSGATLNTRPGANSYANKLTAGVSTSTGQVADDLLWRSDASSVPWVGDIRCWTRMPVSDASVQWTPSGSVVPQTPYSGAGVFSTQTTTGIFVPFTPLCNGSVGAAGLNYGIGYTGNMKCTIFADNAGVPGAVLGSATPLAIAGTTGFNMTTFGTPVSVSANTQYWAGFIWDASGVNALTTTSSNQIGRQGLATTYAAFPTANPALNATPIQCMIVRINITPSGVANAPFVGEPQQDAANSYVYSSTNGQGDRYGISGITGAQPVNIVMVTTTGYFQKSDAGTRNAAMQLKSGAAAAVQSTSTALQAGVWSWLYRNDTVDPNTGAAWTASAVDAVTIGPVVTA